MSGIAKITTETVVDSDHRNIFRAPGYARSLSTAPHLSRYRLIATQQLDIIAYFLLNRCRDLPSLSPCGAIRAMARTRQWRDRGEQQPKHFAWLPKRRLEWRLRPLPLDLIPASLNSCGFWPDRPRGTSSRQKQIVGSVTLGRNKEAS